MLGMVLAVGTAVIESTPASASGTVAVHALGNAPALGAPAGALNAPIVGLASTHDAKGYWLLGQDGGIFSYGDARFYGSTGAMRLNQPVVGIAPTPSGHGYWLVASDGGIFSFGDAGFHGSTGGMHLNQPIVGMAATASGHGYWLVASDGGIFSFGDARFHGSTGGAAIGTTIAAMASSPSGHGYWLAAANGRVYWFGDAAKVASITPASPIAGVQVAPGGKGLWLVARDGAVYATGNAHYYGGASGGMTQAVGIARAAGGHGYWVAMVPSGPPLPANSGSGKRIVYSNAQQRIWLVEANEVVSNSFLVSGRHGLPAVGTYHVFAKIAMEPDGSLMLPWTLKFDPLPSGGVVNLHGIPLDRGGNPIQDDALIGTPQSHGCLRMVQSVAKLVYDWSTVGTTVVVMDIGY
jgi:ribosomal protein L24E